MVLWSDRKKNGFIGLFLKGTSCKTIITCWFSYHNMKLMQRIFSNSVELFIFQSFNLSTVNNFESISISYKNIKTKIFVCLQILSSELTWSGEKTVTGLFWNKWWISWGHDCRFTIGMITRYVTAIAAILLFNGTLVLSYFFHEVKHLEWKWEKQWWLA